MNNALKRLLSLALAVVMVMSYTVMPVSADEGGEHSHSYTEEITTAATCTADGVKTFTCSCSDSYTEAIPATGHSHTEAVTTAATCTADGVKTFTCGCGDSYTEVIPATGHNYSELVSDTATCTVAGVKTTKCACGETKEEVSAATGHSFSDGVADPVATCGEAGVLTKTCNNCGSTETSAIPATGEHDYADGACKVCGAEEPVVCRGMENCQALTHKEDCPEYDWCVAHGCDQENGIHLEGCPYTIPCDKTEGCELIKGHLGDCTGMDTMEDENVANVTTLAELNAAFTAGKDAKLAANITYSGVYAKEWVNVPAGVDVVLDLNGFTLGQTTTASGGLSMAAIIVRAGAALTVKDSSTAQTGKISACNSAFQLEGKLTLESGAIVIGESHSNADVSDEMGFAYGVWMYMRDGATVAPEFYMTGGSISMVDNGYVDDFVNAVAMADSVDGVDERYSNAKVSITGGTFEGSVVIHEKCEDITVPSGTEVVKYAAPVEIDTLEELLTALEADSVAAIYVTAPITIPAGETVELDLNGKTVNLGANYILNNGTLTVKNGSLIAATFNGTTNGAPILNKGTLNIESTAKLTGVCAALRQESGSATINGGEFTATCSDGKTTSYIIRMKGGSLTINDGTFTGCASKNGGEGCSLLGTANGTVEIKGGTFSDFIGVDKNVFGSSTGVTVSGGTFTPSRNPSANAFKNHLAEGFVASLESGTITIKDARVAFIGETGYVTLAKALEAANDNDEILLKLDATETELITISKPVTLNANGKKLSAPVLVTADTTIHGVLNLEKNVKVTNGATLTLAADADVTGATTFFGAGNDENYYGIANGQTAKGTIIINGKLDIQQINANEGGIVTVAQGAEMTTDIICAENGGGSGAPGTVNINGSANTQRFNIFGGSTVNINGSVNSEQDFTSSNIENVVAVWGNATLNISGKLVGGTVEHTEGRHSNMSVAAGAKVSVTSGGELTIGGTLANDGTLTAAMGSTASFGAITGAGTILVDGTNFTGGAVCPITGNVIGFTGTVDAVPGSVVDAEKKVIDSTKAEIVLKSPVAKIEDDYFFSVKDALDSTTGGETIELLWAEGDDPIAMTGEVTGGKTVTITGTATVDWSKDWLFVGRGNNPGDGKLIFKDAKLTSSSHEANSPFGLNVSGADGSATKNNGTVVMQNSEIQLDYLISRGTMEIDGGSLTVYNGFSVTGRKASESASGSDDTATLTAKNGAVLTVGNLNGGIGYEGYGVLNINGATFNYTRNATFDLSAKGTINVNGGTVNFTNNLTNNGTINVNGGNLTVGGTLTNVKDTGIINVYGESTLNIAANAGDDINLRDGAIIKDSTVGGDAYIAGNVTFRGDNTFNLIYDYGTYMGYGADSAQKWTLEQGASLTTTATDPRYGLGYGDQVTIYGELSDAMSARAGLSDADADVNFHSGLVGSSNRGFSDINKFTAQNAYLIFGVAGDKSFGVRNNDFGNYEFTFNNSVVTANGFKFYEGSNSKSKLNAEKTDLLINGHFMTNDADSKFTFTNSRIVSLTTVPGNDVANKNAGELILDNTPVTYNAIFTNTGTVVLKNGSKLVAPQVVNTADGAKIQIDGSAGYKDGDVVIDVTTAFTKETFKNIKVINNDAMKAVINADGDIALESAVAQVGNEYYYDLLKAIEDAEGKTVTLLIDVTADTAINVDKSTILDLNGKTITGDVVVSADGATVKNGKITGELKVDGALILDVESTLTVGTLTINGQVVVDGTKVGSDAKHVITAGTIKLKDNAFEGKVAINQPKNTDKVVSLAMLDGANGTTDINVKRLSLPTATVTSISAPKDVPLTFALNFTANKMSEEDLAYFSYWFADFELKLNKDATFNSLSDEADGYLAGQYNAWSENWIPVPPVDVEMAADEALKIMAYAAELMGQPGLKYTYGKVYGVVKSFNCGVFFTEEYLSEALNSNENLEVTLELRMYNPFDESNSFIVGKAEKFEAPCEAFIDSNENGKLDDGEIKFVTIESAIAAAEKNAAESGDENTNVVIVKDLQKEVIDVPAGVTVTVNKTDIQMPNGGTLKVTNSGNANVVPALEKDVDDVYGTVKIGANTYQVGNGAYISIKKNGSLNFIDEKNDIVNVSSGKYQITKVTNESSSDETASSTYYAKTDSVLVFECNGFFELFDHVEVDGVTLNSKYYTAEKGSTILTLKNSYLKKLGVDEYTLTIYYTNGMKASTAFRVKSAPSIADETNPKTGDFIMMPMAVMTFSAAALAVLLIDKKKHA